MDTDLILLERFIKKHPLQAALAIEDLPDEEVSAFIEGIPVELAVKLTSLMHPYKVAKCLKLIRTDLVVEFLDKTEAHIAEVLLRQVDENFRNELLDRLSPKLAVELRQKLEYPAYSIGAFMVPLDLVLRTDMTVKDVIKAVKKRKDRIPSTVCVINGDGTLAGIIRSHDLLIAHETDQVLVILKPEAPIFFADLPIESIKNHPGWLEYRAIPVVDSSKKLIGMVHFEATRRDRVETDQELSKHVLETSSALGELYRIGLTAFLQSVSKE